ncbi:MAG: hypothetical protein COV29_01390 [Candidatus Yanofskybacteria bacterium CG10_big_fil_rev_8_21_14_0_10_36_16]|uniref:Uncharacterized protein n=1 Tax=Candidatus Yanofskybacteria bacterium CG10_big_fil_rev_8_21_14_0_10_36_16 TaxID=1975096 RepID=A0A2J0Q774_9BACT|nr:MAG: hypothetical protein COV29_01390 [Candidatus Yanofskybacteria bacterium CG10_big_fil_rev_8_21_14_0_10_36_16]
MTQENFNEQSKSEGENMSKLEEFMQDTEFTIEMIEESNKILEEILEKQHKIKQKCIAILAYVKNIDSLVKSDVFNDSSKIQEIIDYLIEREDKESTELSTAIVELIATGVLKVNMNISDAEEAVRSLSEKIPEEQDELNKLFETLELKTTEKKQ